MWISACHRCRLATAGAWAVCRSAVTPLRGAILYQMDAGGGDLRLDFNDQASLLVYYAQLEEDLDRYPGSTKIGEDYLTGGTLMLKPLSGLDLHFIGIYAHGQAPFGPSLTGGSWTLQRHCRGYCQCDDRKPILSGVRLALSFWQHEHRTRLFLPLGHTHVLYSRHHHQYHRDTSPLHQPGGLTQQHFL